MARTILLLVLFGACLAAAIPPAKKLAGAPSEFASMSIPSTTLGALDERSATYRFWLEQSTASPNTVEWSTSLPVDSSDYFGFGFFSPLADALTLQLTAPDGKTIDLRDHEWDTDWPIGESITVPGKSYLFQKPTIGEWTLSVSSSSLSDEQRLAALDSTAPNGLVLLWNSGEYVMEYTHVNTYNLLQNQQIGLVTRVYDPVTYTDEQRRQGVPPTPILDVVSQAALQVILPNGEEVDVQMQDDGLNFDGEANDGVYGATIAATQVGSYTMHAVVQGQTETGGAFIRTTTHLLPVVAQAVTLTGSASTTVAKDADRAEISLYVSGSTNSTLRAYAEVYGTKDNSLVPVCWIGGAVLVESNTRDSNGPYVTLELDLEWLKYAGATEPITLQNVYISDIATSVPLSEVAEISLASYGHIDFVLNNFLKDRVVTEISRKMRKGTMPAAERQRLSTLDNKAVVLVHGYCAEVNPWSKYPEDWTEAEYFLNPNANIDNDAFAQMIIQFANSKGLGSWSLVGHSQGGMASLHTYNYYWTGADIALEKRTEEAKRIVQSIGTPYYGNTGAGSTADFVEVFGVGCGANTDLSRDGANLWVSGIDKESRTELHYYTTQYNTGGLVNYCNLGTNFILKWPNDGLAEYDYSHLDSANNLGHTNGQCHSTDMKWMPQYYDNARNKVMSQTAAR